MTDETSFPLKMIDDQPWYKKGLRFKCTGCGQCCTGSPGIVWVSDDEVEKIAQHLKMSPETFVKNYTRVIQGRLALREIHRNSNYDCIFLRDKKCTIYTVRPKQCSAFPWWPENLSSQKEWESVARLCEGIDHPEASLHSLEEIQRYLDS